MPARDRRMAFWERPTPALADPRHSSHPRVPRSGEGVGHSSGANEAIAPAHAHARCLAVARRRRTGRRPQGAPEQADAPAGLVFRLNEQNRSAIVLCRSYNTDNKAMAGTSSNPNNTAVVRSTEAGNCACGTTELVRA